jgi:hypothetical protein
MRAMIGIYYLIALGFFLIGVIWFYLDCFLLSGLDAHLEHRRSHYYYGLLKISNLQDWSGLMSNG